MRRSGLFFLAIAAGVAVVISSGVASAQGGLAAINQGGSPSDGLISVVYNGATGAVGVDVPNGTALTAINIASEASIFTGGPPLELDGDFDIFEPDTIFKSTFGSSFGSLSFGFVATPGLSESFVANDLTVDGSLSTGGGLGDVSLIYVPEPGSLLLLCLGLAGLIGLSGRQRRAR